MDSPRVLSEYWGVWGTTVKKHRESECSRDLGAEFVPLHNAFHCFPRVISVKEQMMSLPKTVQAESCVAHAKSH